MILVTGGTGLLGAHLLYRLVKKGEPVRAIFRNEQNIQNTRQVFECYSYSDSSLFQNIEWVEADLLDIPALLEAFKDITHVYHCAALVSFEPYKYHSLRRINIEGTANIVNICLDKSIQKLCYVSSIATLGSPIKNETVTEQTFWNPEDDNSVYGITKFGAEMEVWRGTQEGLDAVIVNPGVILGAGIWHYGSGSLFKKAYNGFKYYPKGSAALVAVEDVTNIMIQLMHSQIKNERYVLVAENWSYKRFLSALAQSVNKKAPQKIASNLLLQVAWRADWLLRLLFGRRRQLTKQVVKSLRTTKIYSSEKIETQLDYSFKPIEKTIKDLGHLYLKQVQ